MKHRRKLCEIFSRQWKLKVSSVSFYPRTYDSSLCYTNLSFSFFFLFRWKMIVIVSQCTFASVVCFELSCESTKLSGHVSHLIIPACRRGACGALVPENMTRRRSKERSRTRFLLYLGDKSKFPASPLFRATQISLPVFSLYSTMLSPCSFTILNFNERHFYRLKSRYFLCENSMAVHYSQYLICSRFSFQ